MNIPDIKERELALDVSKSFLVQAPAGSGKTGLLIQRHLKLLAQVENPEEVVSITFTKKATGEMRFRIIEALLKAASGEKPASEYEKLTITLAKEVLNRDQLKGWNLLKNSFRLNIYTIDKLSLSLTKQMPWLSRVGGDTGIEDKPAELYKEATIKVLELMEHSSGDAVRVLMAHFDNKPEKFINLLSSMLANRDQWLRHIMPEKKNSAKRETLELVLKKIINKTLLDAKKEAPPFLSELLPPLARFAASNLVDIDPYSPIINLKNIDESLSPTIEIWKGIAELLLIKNGKLRKSVNKNSGFPLDMKQEKQNFLKLIKNLAGFDGFLNVLRNVKELPSTAYSEKQWKVMEAIIAILPILNKKLLSIFKERSVTDFPQVASDALLALGSEDSPTNLLLALDYKIKHLLIDEFQDTSLRQYLLIKMLTSGWCYDDGRTLFLVGDPMQSIYLFREAEVDLFKRVKELGIGDVKPDYIRLTSNFRSCEGIVEWVNRTFSGLFDKKDDSSPGAVSYSSFTAVKQDSVKSKRVFYHPYEGKQLKAQADEIVNIIKTAHKINPDETIAILLRSRTNVGEIINGLQLADISYQANEIESLADKQIVQDLLALTRAIMHPADKVAWLSILRAPWCGMLLNDLYILCDASLNTIFSLLTERISSLSEDGQSRALKLIKIMEQTKSELGSVRLSSLVRGCWLSLGGAAYIDEKDLANAERFFRLIDELDYGGLIKPFSILEKRIAEMKAETDPQGDEKVQIMTIHSSKGLEFDRVILPSLGSPPKADNSPLLLWMELPMEGLLMAGIPEKYVADPLSNYIKKIIKIKQQHEVLRVLYVASTRSKKYLHLMGSLKRSKNNLAPSSKSLLGLAWKALEVDFVEGLDEQQLLEENFDIVKKDENFLKRLDIDWQLPDLPDSIVANEDIKDSVENDASEVPEFFWAGKMARELGKAAHLIMQKIAEKHLEPFIDEISNDYFIHALEGVSCSQINDAVDEVKKIIENALSDNKGRWIMGLDEPMEKEACEYHLSGEIDGKIIHRIIDRTFVDKKGVRWIIDYKTGGHNDRSSVGQFLDNELLRYSSQLETYVALFSHLEPDRKIRAALYYPQLSGWRELEVSQK